MSQQPPSPPPAYYPPSPPQKSGLSKDAKVVIIVGIVVVAVFVLGLRIGTLQQQAAQQQAADPNIEVTNRQGVYSRDCGGYASNTTTWTLSATLVNTGGRGYAEIAYQLNGATVTSNNYFVNSQSSLDIRYAFSLNSCQDPAGSTYSIVVTSQRGA